MVPAASSVPSSGAAPKAANTQVAWYDACPIPREDLSPFVPPHPYGIQRHFPQLCSTAPLIRKPTLRQDVLWFSKSLHAKYLERQAELQKGTFTLIVTKLRCDGASGEIAVELFVGNDSIKKTSSNKAESAVWKFDGANLWSFDGIPASKVEGDSDPRKSK